MDPGAFTPHSRVSTSHSFTVTDSSHLIKNFTVGYTDCYLEIYLHEEASKVSNGVVTFYRQILDQGMLRLEMEYCPNGDLQTILEDRAREHYGQPFDVNTLGNFALQMLATLQALHGARIAHRQIALRHWVVNGSTLKLIDFAGARPIERSRTNGVYTLRNSRENSSPYASSSEKTGEPVHLNPFKEDIWSLGKVLYELATCKTYRFLNTTPEEVLAMELQIQSETRGFGPLRSVLQKMLAWKEDDRATASEALALLQAEINPKAVAYPVHEEGSTVDPAYSQCSVCGATMRTEASSYGLMCPGCSAR